LIKGLESFWEVFKSKLGDVPELVAKFSISFDSLDIKIDGVLDHV